MTTRPHPCQDAGDPARDVPLKVNRRCAQTKGPDGNFINNGPYYEWYANGKTATEGAYKMGHKDGKWVEYDETGHMVSTKYFDNGTER